MSEFIKEHGKNAGSDWQRVVWLHELAQNCRLFYSPKPISRCESKISYERIEKFISGIELCFSNDPAEKFYRIGMALAAIHEKARTEDCNPVNLHGDFGLVNLGWSMEKSMPVIFDPLPSAFYPYHGALGDRYYDLGQLVSTFFTPANSLALMRGDSRLLEKCLHSFMLGYQYSAQLIIDRGKLARFARTIFRRHLLLRIASENPVVRILLVPLVWLQQRRMLGVIACLTTD